MPLTPEESKLGRVVLELQTSAASDAKRLSSDVMDALIEALVASPRGSTAVAARRAARARRRERRRELRCRCLLEAPDELEVLEHSPRSDRTGGRHARTDLRVRRPPSSSETRSAPDASRAAARAESDPRH